MDKRQKSIVNLFKILIYSLVLSSFLSISCYAKEGNTEISEETQTIRVVFPKQEGLSEIDEFGNYSGYTYDYLQRIAQFTNWKYEFITFPDLTEDEAIMKSIEMIQNGEADLFGGLLKMDGLTDMFDYPSESYGVVYTTLSVLESNADISETNYMLQTPLRVAVLENAETRRAEMRNYLDSIGVTYEEVLCEDMEEQTQTLLDHKADALLRVSLSFVKGTKQIAQFSPRPYYFVTTKGNQKILNELDTATRQINENYPYFESNLFQKYFGDSSGGFVLSDSDKTFLQENATLHALYMINNAPYSMEVDGKPSGILVSLLDDFASATGITVEYTPINSLSELQQYRLDGQNYDCILGTLFCMSSDSQYGMVTTNTLFQSDVKQFYKRTSSYKELEDSVIALHNGCGLEKYLSDAKEIRWYDTIDDCVAAVKSGECDCGYADSYSIEYAAEKNEVLFTTIPFYGKKEDVQLYMLNTGNLEYLSIINRYINNLSVTQVHTYIADTTNTIQIDGLLYFIRSNPIAACSILLLIIALLIFCISMFMFVKKLRKTNAQLKIANSAKSDFLSRISHDMRTPLNGILGLLHLMKDKKECKTLQTELSQMEMSGKYLLDLINDTLDVGKIESGHLELHPIAYDGERIAKNTLTLLQPSLAEKHITLTTHFEKCVFKMLYIDVGRFEQVFMNIIGNAIKFTPKYGNIDVTIETLSEQNGVLTDRVTIKDNGIGMSEEFLPHLFEPFSQEDNAKTSRYKGTGLGMTICKQIIELMNGEIHVTSNLGEGTTFVFTVELPLATQEEIDENDALKRTNVDDSVLQGKRVLLFEDHPLNAEIATRLLQKKGVKVERAENGAKGLEMFTQAAEHYYDAILMDIRMPVMDGLEASTRIRALKNYGASIPIIAMTANAFDEDVKQCHDAGMNAHLAKPIEPLMLYETLAMYVG